jgi:hypothetical protein
MKMRGAGFRWTRIAVGLAFVVVLAACGSGGPTATEGPGSHVAATPAATTSTGGGDDRKPGTNLTACQLVAPADIEAALGFAAGSVADGTLKVQGTVLDPAVNECRYTDEWGGLVVLVTPTDGVNVYQALVKVYGDKAEAISVGDGGLWFEDNDRGYFLKGSVLVQLQFTGLAGQVPFRGPTVALGTAAVAKI